MISIISNKRVPKITDIGLCHLPIFNGNCTGKKKFCQDSCLLEDSNWFWIFESNISQIDQDSYKIDPNYINGSVVFV